MDGQYNRLVWCINTRTIPRCFGETKMASNNENGIGHLRALVPWLMMMMMMTILLYSSSEYSFHRLFIPSSSPITFPSLDFREPILGVNFLVISFTFENITSTHLYLERHVPRSRTSTSQQCAFASAGPLLWNCLPVKTHAQILSSSLSSTPRLLKSFLFPGAYRTGGRL